MAMMYFPGALFNDMAKLSLLTGLGTAALNYYYGRFSYNEGVTLAAQVGTKAALQTGAGMAGAAIGGPAGKAAAQIGADYFVDDLVENFVPYVPNLFGYSTEQGTNMYYQSQSVTRRVYDYYGMMGLGNRSPFERLFSSLRTYDNEKLQGMGYSAFRNYLTGSGVSKLSNYVEHAKKESYGAGLAGYEFVKGKTRKYASQAERNILGTQNWFQTQGNETWDDAYRRARENTSQYHWKNAKDAAPGALQDLLNGLVLLLFGTTVAGGLGTSWINNILRRKSTQPEEAAVTTDERVQANAEERYETAGAPSLPKVPTQLMTPLVSNDTPFTRNIHQTKNALVPSMDFSSMHNFEKTKEFRDGRSIFYGLVQRPENMPTAETALRLATVQAMKDTPQSYASGLKLVGKYLKYRHYGAAHNRMLVGERRLFSRAFASEEAQSSAQLKYHYYKRALRMSDRKRPKLDGY